MTQTEPPAKITDEATGELLRGAREALESAHWDNRSFIPEDGGRSVMSVLVEQAECTHETQADNDAGTATYCVDCNLTTKVAGTPVL